MAKAPKAQAPKAAQTDTDEAAKAPAQTDAAVATPSGLGDQAEAAPRDPEEHELTQGTTRVDY